VSRRLWVAASVVAVPLLVYPVVYLAQGAPKCPTRAECVHPPADGSTVAVVFGRTEDPLDAGRLRDRVVSVGFKGTETVPDGCGLWKVLLDNVPNVTIARGIQDEAHTVGLQPTLERGSEG
jgi:hypothetical protein